MHAMVRELNLEELEFVSGAGDKKEQKAPDPEPALEDDGSGGGGNVVGGGGNSLPTPPPLPRLTEFDVGSLRDLRGIEIPINDNVKISLGANKSGGGAKISISF